MILDHNGSPIAATQKSKPETREIAVANVRDK